jgi:predicted PurR-regulated permease PerM
MYAPIAEIKPSDILYVVFSIVVGGFMIFFAAVFIGVLLQPFYALLTGRKIDEESKVVWFWILVAAAIFGLLYWQFS